MFKLDHVFCLLGCFGAQVVFFWEGGGGVFFGFMFVWIFWAV